ncbi:MAG: CheF family chemotaxis protein [Archaeoglobaceae archaeon]|nr:CheF family chemotaxis protein [Archaeoglobales archaeon]MDI9643035.1 CheF family chemotaxis protein [Archaeoglobales archaeon]
MPETKLIAEFFEQNWKKVEVLITEKSLVWEKSKIDFREVADLEIVQHVQKECIRIRREKDYYFNFGEKQKQVFRFLAFNIKSDKFAVYFLSPALRGGVLVSNSKWEKGYFSITESAVWFLSPERQIRVPLNTIGSVNKDTRTVGDKSRVVLSLSHMENKEVVTSFILCPETTLELLLDYLRRILEQQKPKEKLSDIEEQILTMVYTGLDSSNIESVLGISTEELNKIYDKFVNLGIAKVVKIRKEIELTPKGVVIVSESAKKLGGGKSG